MKQFDENVMKYELRQDSFTNRQVLIVEGRSLRPRDIAISTEPKKVVRRDADCPFCEGNESKTPRETWALREGNPDSPGWQIRSFENRYPINAHHELIVETPVHSHDLPDLTDEEMELLVKSYRDRLLAASDMDNVEYGLLFKNRGLLGGASLAHSHAQLIGLETIPALINEELALARKYYETKQSCLYCQTINDELNQEERIIRETDNFVAVAPYASRFPYECWILPRAHWHDFLDLGDQYSAELGSLLKQIIGQLRVRLFNHDWAYNFYIHTAPHHCEQFEDADDLRASYHWHIELFPRITNLAGLEWGGGVLINSVSPERAAEHLRKTKF